LWSWTNTLLHLHNYRRQRVRINGDKHLRLRSGTDGLPQGQLVHRYSEQGLERLHGLGWLNGADVGPGGAVTMGMRGRHPHATPVTPVHDLDGGPAVWAGPFPRQPVGEGILEGTASGVVALARWLEEAGQGGKEEDQV